MFDCDFIPADFHESQSMHHAVRRRISLIAALLVLMGVWVAVHQRELASAEAVMIELSHQKKQLEIDLARKQAMEARRAVLEEHRRLLRDLGASGSAVVVFSDLSRRLPETVVLTRLQWYFPSVAAFAQPRGPESADPKPEETRAKEAAGAETPPDLFGAGGRVLLSGIAAETSDVIQCAAQLERSPLVDHVEMQLDGPVVWSGRRAQGFRLTCLLNKQKSE